MGFFVPRFDANKLIGVAETLLIYLVLNDYVSCAEGPHRSILRPDFAVVDGQAIAVGCAQFHQSCPSSLRHWLHHRPSAGTRPLRPQRKQIPVA